MLEILITVAILSIMCVVVIVSLFPVKNKMALNAAKREVASAIKLAQSYSFQGRVMEDGGGNGVKDVPIIYGVQIHPNEYKICFRPDDGSGTGGCESMISAHPMPPGVTMKGQYIKEADGTYIDNGYTFFNITFGIPYGAVWYPDRQTQTNDESARPKNSLAIIFTHASGLSEKLIMNSRGSIVE